MNSNKLQPTKDHYIDEDELSHEYCAANKCTACFGIDQNGEPNGYGCPGQERFLDDNYELILDFEEAYFLLDRKIKQKDKIIEELKGELGKEKMTSNFYAMRGIELARECNELRTKVEKMENDLS